MKKWELEQEINEKDLERNLLKLKVERLQKEIYTGDWLMSSIDEHVKETWQQRTRFLSRELQDAQSYKKYREDIFEVQNNTIKRLNTTIIKELEKNKKLKNEIKKSKGLKVFCITSNDDIQRYDIEADYYHENDNYTEFEIEEEEVFKIKTNLIETITTKEF